MKAVMKALSRPDITEGPTADSCDNAVAETLNRASTRPGSLQTDRAWASRAQGNWLTICF